MSTEQPKQQQLIYVSTSDQTHQQQPATPSLTQKSNTASTNSGFGMSSLFHSLLKNSSGGGVSINNSSSPSNLAGAKNSSSSPPIDSGYDSKHEMTNQIRNNQTPTHAIAASKTLAASPTNLPIQQQSSPLRRQTSQSNEFDSADKTSSLAKMKLKNLQEAIAKNYSPEQLAQYGIFIPGVNFSTLNSSANSENSNTQAIKQQQQQQQLKDQNYYRLKYDLNGKGSSKQSSSGNDMPPSSSLDYASMEAGANNERHQASLRSHPFYFGVDNKLVPISPPFCPANNNACGGYFQHQPSPVSSSVSYPSASRLSPISQLSSSPVMSSVSPTSSTVSSTTGSNSTSTNGSNITQSTLNNKESVLLSAVAAAAAAVNMNSPLVFSKYIESVHKALHGHSSGGGRVSEHGFRSPSAASSDITTSNDMLSNNDSNMLNDAATLMASSSSLLQGNDASTTAGSANASAASNSSFTKSFVEHRRQLFEKTLSASSSSSGGSTTMVGAGSSGSKKQLQLEKKKSMEEKEIEPMYSQQQQQQQQQQQVEATLKSIMASRGANLGVGDHLALANTTDLHFNRFYYINL